LAKRKTLAPWKPSREIQLKSIARRVPDVIAENLNVLFCGINPGLYSAAVGHHFAGPGNLFWPTIHRAGLTPRLFTAFDEPEMAALGFGITNLVPRASKDAEDLTKEELRVGAKTVKRKTRKFKPRFLAVLGLAAYRTAFEKTKAQVGYQDQVGETKVYLLPNPSGLNAFHQPAVLNQMFLAFREELLKDGIALPEIPILPPPEPKAPSAKKQSLKTSLG
jgi:TDG/mug DNA glycosylase family protein